MAKKIAIVLAFAGAVIYAAIPLAPHAFAQAAPARAADAYAQGLLWKIERAGVQPSYVFGTIHIADPRVTTLPEPVKQSFDTSTTFAMEVLFDPANVLQLATRMLYMDGRDLAVVAGQDTFDRAVAASASLGLPPEVLRRFKPWAAALLLMAPEKDTDSILDNRLYQSALQQKKSVQQLETLDEQVNALEGLSEGDQVALLRVAAAEHDRLPSQVQRLVDAYLRRDLAALARLNAEDVGPDPALKRLNERLMQRLLDDRNVRMAERMEAHLKAGRAFVAIGALHLYGDGGVLARLARCGYRISRVY